jgi:hypothetical protein
MVKNTAYQIVGCASLFPWKEDFLRHRDWAISV